MRKKDTLSSVDTDTQDISNVISKITERQYQTTQSNYLFSNISKKILINRKLFATDLTSTANDPKKQREVLRSSEYVEVVFPLEALEHIHPLNVEEALCRVLNPSSSRETSSCAYAILLDALLKNTKYSGQIAVAFRSIDILADMFEFGDTQGVVRNRIARERRFAGLPGVSPADCFVDQDELAKEFSNTAKKDTRAMSRLIAKAMYFPGIQRGLVTSAQCVLEDWVFPYIRSAEEQKLIIDQLCWDDHVFQTSYYCAGFSSLLEFFLFFALDENVRVHLRCFGAKGNERL